MLNTRLYFVPSEEIDLVPARCRRHYGVVYWGNPNVHAAKGCEGEDVAPYITPDPVSLLGQ
jgi:hypothetical protein